MTWGDPSGLSRFTPATLAYGGADGADQEASAFHASLAAGVTLFDTAAMYSNGASERRLGDLAQGTSALVATKFPSGPRATAEDMPGALQASLARLRRTTIDLYQHHFPSRRVDIPTLMGLMADAVDAGQVRAVGVSNYSAAQMRTAHRVLADRGIPLAANQVQYSLLHRRPEVDGVLDTCRELGVTLIAYQPLASGALTGKYLDGQRPRGLRPLMPNFRGKARQAITPVVGLLAEIAAHHGQTATQSHCDG
jgi:aryl-alcohol dehydrogenase-like predicted oxidoreductase